MKQLVRYLAGTPNYGLMFNCPNKVSLESMSITIYTDASWGADVNDRKSTSGTLVMFNGNIINWSSKRQSTVALSSCEAEYYAISTGTQEALWYQSLLCEMFSVAITPTILTDNQAAQILAEDATDHKRTRHIDIRHHFIRDHTLKGTINIDWVPTDQQLADILTNQ